MHNQTIELAIEALEAKRTTIEQAITNLKAVLNGDSAEVGFTSGGGEVPTPFALPPKAPRQKRAKRRLTAAGRKALSDSAKRRWAKARAKGKSAL